MSHKRAQQSKRRKELERKRERAWRRIMDMPSTRGTGSGPVFVNGATWFDRQAIDEPEADEEDR